MQKRAASRSERIGRALICLGATMFALPLWIEQTIPAVLGTLELTRSDYPNWGDIMLVASSLPLVVGLFVGTLGSGERPSLRQFGKRLFEFPCWIPVSAILVGFALGCLFYHARGS